MLALLLVLLLLCLVMLRFGCVWCDVCVGDLVGLCILCCCVLVVSWEFGCAVVLVGGWWFMWLLVVGLLWLLGLYCTLGVAMFHWGWGGFVL